MALDFQVSQFPFRLGLAEGTDPRQVPPGTLTTAENAVWLQSGRVQKRLGTTALPVAIMGGLNITEGERIFTRGNELCLVSDTRLYAYSPALAKWKTIDRIPGVGITSVTLTDTVQGTIACDSTVAASGVRVDAWVTSDGSAFVQVVEPSSGSVLMPPTYVIATIAGIRVLTIGNTAIILTRNGTAITAATLDLSTLGAVTTTTLRNDAASTGFDACVIGSRFVIAYTATGPLLKLYSYDSALVQQASGGITSETLGAKYVAIADSSSGVIYVLYSEGDSAGPKNLVRIATADYLTLAQATAPVTVEDPGVGIAPSQVAVCRYDSSSCIAAYVVADGMSRRVTTYRISNTASVFTTTERSTYGAQLLSRPFMLGSRCFMALSNTASSIISGKFVYDVSSVLVEVETVSRVGTRDPHRYVGCIDVLIGANSGATDCPVAGAAVKSGTSVYVPMPFQSSAATFVARLGLRLVNFTIGSDVPRDMWRTVLYGQDLFVSGGILSAYDGRIVFDYGFPRAPTFYSVTPSNGAGAMALGTYLYGLVYEYRSSTGTLFRSPAQTVGGTATLTGANNTVTVKTTGFNLGNKQNIAYSFGTSNSVPTITALYRSTVGGTVYQRMTIEPTYVTSYVDQRVDGSTIVDVSADSDIGGSTIPLATRPVIYTTGGILDDYAPPGSVTMFLHGDRLWLLSTDQRTWWYSKSFQDDLGTAPGFHPNFRIAFAETQTAGASMDDKAVFFSTTGVSYMLGLGPAPNGQNSDFNTPTKIQTDVGCTNARSVVGTPDGVMFLSDRGIYLLTRGLELVWIGRPVKETLAAYPVVTSAVLVAKRNQVRFTCNATDGLTGVVIVYDYVEKQWSTSKYYDGSTYGCAIADACMYNGAWTFVTAAGKVFIESETTYLDNGTYVPMILETAWLSSNGPLAFQSVADMILHGTSYTDQDLTISVGFDNNPSYPQVASFLAQSPAVAVGDIDCTVSIGTRRKCNTIRFKIVDTIPTSGTVGTGRGPAFDMMGLKVGVKRGPGNSPATKRA